MRKLLKRVAQLWLETDTEDRITSGLVIGTIILITVMTWPLIPLMLAFLMLLLIGGAGIAAFVTMIAKNLTRG